MPRCLKSEQESNTFIPKATLIPHLPPPGNIQSAPGINGSVAGVHYNGVDILKSYLRRDLDFRNVAVEMGGDVTIKEREWITIEESEFK